MGDVCGHWKGHSESGWTTEDVFEKYLDCLARHYNGELVHLILDSYSAHRTQRIINYAAMKNISLHFIPPGLTDKWQPLDRRVFGVLKAYARRLFRERTEFAETKGRTRPEAVQDLLAAWSRISKNLILDAWKIYRTDEDDDDDQ